jgi:hypothetical protein
MMLLRNVYVVYVDRRQVSLRVINVVWTDLDSLTFILHLFNHFYVASRSVCSFCVYSVLPKSVFDAAMGP